MGRDDRTKQQDSRLEFLNRVIYSAMPGLYSAMDWATFGAWWNLVRRALDHCPPGQTVLEVGFGPGRLHVELAKQAKLCVGLDLAKGMCCYTHRRLLKAGLPSRITRGSVFAMPYPDNTFNIVVSTFAFSGFPDGQNAMNELARVTKPDGQVVLIDITLPPDGNRLGTFLARTWEWMGDFLYDQPAMMQSAGLTIDHIQTFGPGNHIHALVGKK